VRVAKRQRNLAKDEKTFFAKRREEVGQEQRVFVLRARHHVQELVARGPDVLRKKITVMWSKKIEEIQKSCF